MDAAVQTGQTRAQDGITLMSKTLTTAQGESVVVLLQIHAESSSAGRGFQKECLDVIGQALIDAEGETTNRLDSTLKEMNGLIKGMLLSKTIQDVHAVIAVATPDAMFHVSHAGRAEAYVVRAGAASQITEYTKGKSSPAFVHIASGRLEARDVVIISTQRLLRALTPAQLAQLASRHHALPDELRGALEAEAEQAAFAVINVGAGKDQQDIESIKASVRSRPRADERKRQRSKSSILAAIPGLVRTGINAAAETLRSDAVKSGVHKAKGRILSFRKDMKDPTRKRRAHFLLIAGVLGAILIVWALLNLTSFSQRNQTKAELQALVDEINEDVRTAENRRLTGELDAANAILKRAEERAKQVIGNQSGYFRQEAGEILARIQAKREEINNVIRLSPRVVANLAAKKPDIMAIGMIGLEDEEFLVYDRQDLYRVLHNSIDDPSRVANEELLVDGVAFPRYQTTVFLTTGNGVTEIISGQPTSMKTEDPAGWIAGKDIEAYLRYIYVLSPENNQIYKYERLSNRYGPPAGYNVNGNIEKAVDMAIDGNVYILKEGGEVTKLLRGEVQPFAVRSGPDELLTHATKIYKVPDGNIYFLDPVRSRVIVTTDGGSAGDASYLKQYVLESDEIGELKDIFVDSDETRLYVSDEKRIYKVDLNAR
ncbi:MAG: hypothetical protein PHO92_00215 [Candidatus Peribacteraceae bacterium]|nr:hypothetical protein [Candidatus Peribacteraceae bacterium]